MKRINSKLTYTKIILLPLLCCFVAFGFIAANYIKHVDDQITNEYKHIYKSLDDSVSLLSAINYNFSVIFDNPDIDPLIQQQESMRDGLCYFSPADERIQSAYRSDSVLTLKLDYQFVGMGEVCEEGSVANEKLQNKTILAPTFSFLSQMNESVFGLYYFSRYGYMLASPSLRVDEISPTVFNLWKTRPYWTEAERGNNTTRLNGPYLDPLTNRSTLSISVGVYDKGEFQGVVVKDILVNKLLQSATVSGHKIKMISLRDEDIPRNAWFVSRIKVDDLETDQVMYLDFSWLDELRVFVKEEIGFLFGLFAFYLFALVVLIGIKMQNEKEYLQQASQQDPMTGLLNRRGLEIVYREKNHKVKLSAIAVFDIDDFKKINDTYGHDVGDDVICMVADSMSNIVRSTDSVARFGGEEFVILMQGEKKEQIITALERIRSDIQSESKDIIENGFTISCGVCFATSDEHYSLEEFIKHADDKLYEAKNNGKNQVVV